MDNETIKQPEVIRELNDSLAPKGDLKSRLEATPPPKEEMAFQGPARSEPVLHLELNTEDALKRPIKLAVDIPNDITKWGLLERAVAAKMDPGGAWFQAPLMTVINAIVFADRQGLSFEEGDVYKPQDSTRFSLTAKARIKRGMASGMIREYHVEVTDGPPVKIPWATYREKGDWEGPNYHCVVTLWVNGWNKPAEIHSDLTEWFEGYNKNWRVRPKYMLEMSTLGRAFELIKPGATTSDETPEEDRPKAISKVAL